MNRVPTYQKVFSLAVGKKPRVEEAPVGLPAPLQVYSISLFFRSPKSQEHWILFGTRFLTFMRRYPPLGSEKMGRGLDRKVEMVNNLSKDILSHTFTLDLVSEFEWKYGKSFKNNSHSLLWL